MTQTVLSACNQGKKTLTSWSPFRGICNHLEGAPSCSAETQCGPERGSVCACQNQHSVTGTCSEPPCNNSPNGLYQALMWPCFPGPYGSCVVLAGRGWSWVVLPPWWSGHVDFSPGRCIWLRLGDCWHYGVKNERLAHVYLYLSSPTLSYSHFWYFRMGLWWIQVDPVISELMKMLKVYCFGFTAW